MSTPSDVVVWEDPPAPTHGPGSTKWLDLLSPLLAHPGRWARVSSKDTRGKASATVNALQKASTPVGQVRRHHRMHRIPPGRWEFVARKRGEGEFGVYARYIGPDLIEQPAEAAS